VEPSSSPVTAMTTVYSEHRADLVVADRRNVAEDVVSLTLVDPSGGELPQWTPGAHIDVLLDEQIGRQYSLCGSPGDRSSWRIGVLLDRNGRGGSRRVHEALRPEVLVSVRGPRNHFPLVAAERYIFIAGGIGITPLLPMISQASAAGADWKLYYGGRRRPSMAFVDELEAYGDDVQLWPEDERGMLDLAAILGEPRADTLVYTCGPEGLLGAVEQRCATWPSGSLHVERFAAKAQAAPAEPDGSFEVLCQRSGFTVTVPPDKTILEAVEQAGISVLSSCRDGVCGTCETRVVEGVPDHRDSLLTEDERAEGDYMMICVSRAVTERLVLEL
jgi:ferredoxin-NADP reductase